MIFIASTRELNSRSFITGESEQLDRLPKPMSTSYTSSPSPLEKTPEEAGQASYDHDDTDDEDDDDSGVFLELLERAFVLSRELRT